MYITWLGTATFVLESGGERILFDPFRQLQGGEVGLAEEDLLAYDTVFITHCHFDHFSFVAEKAEEWDCTVFCTGQCIRTMDRLGCQTDRLVRIEPGQTYRIGQIRIRPLKARHIDFQWRHLMDTMSPLRTLRYASNLPYLFWANRTFKEGGEILAYQIEAEGRTILLLGSLAIDATEAYPHGADLLILPYQGNSNLPAQARQVIGTLRPKAILLSHFDNAFPPMSRNVDLRSLKKLVKEEFPSIKVVKPLAGKLVRI